MIIDVRLHPVITKICNRVSLGDETGCLLRLICLIVTLRDLKTLIQLLSIVKNLILLHVLDIYVKLKPLYKKK
jgi:hypothetical protein